MDGGVPDVPSFDGGSQPALPSDAGSALEPRPDAGTALPHRAARLEIINADAVAMVDWLHFNAFGSTPSHRDYRARKVAGIRLANAADATGPLTLHSLAVSGPWQVVAAPGLPYSLAPGEAVDVTLEFIAAGEKKVWRGTLDVHTSDAVTPVRTLQLAGIWMKAP